jgi:hypothetical protein
LDVVRTLFVTLAVLVVIYVAHWNAPRRPD